MQYKIKFSDADATAKIRTGAFDEQGRLETREVNKRDIERNMLSNLNALAYNGKKKLADMNVCMDFEAQLEAADDHVILQEIDLDNLREALEESSGKRPTVWMAIPEIFKQLRNPEEYHPESMTAG